MLVDDDKTARGQKPKYVPIIKAAVPTIARPHVPDNLRHQNEAARGQDKPPLVFEKCLQQHIALIGQNYIMVQLQNAT